MVRSHVFKRIAPSCSLCGKKMHVIVYTNRKYRGGHYFFDVPVYEDGAWERARRRFGEKTVKIGSLVATMLKKEPKPKSHFEYWECPKCYWKK